MKRIIRRMIALMLVSAMSLSLLATHGWAVEPNQEQNSGTIAENSVGLQWAEEESGKTDTSTQQEDGSTQDGAWEYRLEDGTDSADGCPDSAVEAPAREADENADGSGEDSGAPPQEKTAESNADASGSEADGSSDRTEETSQPEQSSAAERDADKATVDNRGEAERSGETSLPEAKHAADDSADKPAEENNVEDETQKPADDSEGTEEVGEASAESSVSVEPVPQAESSGEGAESERLDGEQSQEDESLAPQDAGENKSVYQIIDLPYTWEQAKAYCEEKGGHLATITSEEEQKAVEEAISAGTKNCYWLGGYKEAKKWHWITGEPFEYVNWGLLQPDNYAKSEDKLMIYRKKNPNRLDNTVNKWNDIKSDGTCKNEEFFGSGNFGFVCEWDASLMMDEVIEIEDNTPTTISAVYVSKTKPQTISWGNDKGLRVDYSRTVVDGPEITGVKNTYWIYTMVTVNCCDEYRLTLGVDGQKCESTLRVLPTIKELKAEGHVKSAVLSYSSVEQEQGIESIEYVINYKAKEAVEKTTEEERIRIDGLKRNKNYEFKVRAKVRLTNGSILEGKEKTIEVKTADRPSAENCWGFANPNLGFFDTDVSINPIHANKNKIMPIKYFEHYYTEEVAKRAHKNGSYNGDGGICFGMCLSACATLSDSKYCNMHSVKAKKLAECKDWYSLENGSDLKENIYYAHAYQYYKNSVQDIPLSTQSFSVEDIKSALDKYLYDGGDAVLLEMYTGARHAVWAMDYYENKKNNQLIVYIYDCNKPGSLRELTIDNKKNTWKYDTYGGAFPKDSNSSLEWYVFFEKMSKNKPKPSKPKITKVTSGKGQMTVTWDKSESCSCYYVLYSDNKKFEKAEYKQINGKNKTSVTIKKLTTGKKYFCKVRAARDYRVSDDSEVKKIKIK